MQRLLALIAAFLTMVGAAGCALKPSPTVSPLKPSPTVSQMLSIPLAEEPLTSPLVKSLPDVDDSILFISFQDESPGIYAVSPDGEMLVPIVRMPRSSRIAGPLDWSATRKQIAFSVAQGARNDLFVADLMTSALYNVTGEIPFGGVEPRWSPDGTRLAYVCGEYGPDICVIDADGSDYVQLTSHPSWDINPSWAPDGSAIAYQTNRGGLSDIYVLGLGNLTEQDLTRGISQNVRPSWSPGGEAILFQSDRDGSMDIFVISLSDFQTVNLTGNKALDVDPQWSPDGEFIAFRSDREGEWAIYVMKRDGSNLMNLTAGWGPIFNYTWSPDSRSIAFASEHKGNSDIYKVDVRSGSVTQLTHHPAADIAPLWISLSK